jgi:hypothetical protein
MDAIAIRPQTISSTEMLTSNTSNIFFIPHLSSKDFQSPPYFYFMYCQKRRPLRLFNGNFQPQHENHTLSSQCFLYKTAFGGGL